MSLLDTSSVEDNGVSGTVPPVPDQLGFFSASQRSTISETQGTLVPKSVPAETQGTTVPEMQATTVLETQDTTVPKTQATTVLQSQGTTVPESAPPEKDIDSTYELLEHVELIVCCSTHKVTFRHAAGYC